MALHHNSEIIYSGLAQRPLPIYRYYTPSGERYCMMEEI